MQGLELDQPMGGAGERNDQLRSTSLSHGLSLSERKPACVALLTRMERVPEIHQAGGLVEVLGTPF